MKSCRDGQRAHREADQTPGKTMKIEGPAKVRSDKEEQPSEMFDAVARRLGSSGFGVTHDHEASLFPLSR